MNTNAFALVEYLNSPFSHPDINLLAIILVRYAVIMLFNLDMIVKTDFTFKPVIVYIPVIRKCYSIRSIKFFKQLMPLFCQFLHRLAV